MTGGLAGPLLGLAGSLLALGAGYQEAAEKMAQEWSASGLSRGVVMGADRRPARQVTETFGRLSFPPSPFFPRGCDLAITNYRGGLFGGYVQRRLLSANRVIFWRDLGRRMGDQSYRRPQRRCEPLDWRKCYVDVAAALSCDLLVHSE